MDDRGYKFINYNFLAKTPTNLTIYTTIRSQLEADNDKRHYHDFHYSSKSVKVKYYFYLIISNTKFELFPFFRPEN